MLAFFLGAISSQFGFIQRWLNASVFSLKATTLSLEFFKVMIVWIVPANGPKEEKKDFYFVLK